MAEVEYPQVGYGLAVALDEGSGTYNYAVLKESGTGLPVVLAAEGLDDNIDIKFVPKGTGTVDFGGVSFATLNVAGLSTFGTAFAARITATGGATATNGGAGVLSTAGTDTNTHLLLTTKNAASVVESNRPFIHSVSSSLDALVGLRNTATSFWSNNNVVYAGAMDARFRVTGAVAGTITGSNFAINEFTVATDNVNAASSGGLSGLYIGMNVGGTNFVGNRTGVTAKVNWVTTSPIQTPFRFMTGGSFGGYISTAASPTTAFGYGYDETDGYVFGGLLQARAETGARFVKSIQGLELNVGNYEINVPTFDMGGIQVVMENADLGPWMRQSNAYGFANQTAWPNSSQGWGVGYAYAQANGRWAVNRTYGQIMGGNWTGQYGPKPNCADGIDFAQVDFSRAAFRGSNGSFLVDGSGNVGGANVGGVELRTRSEIGAYTNVVGAITVLDGSLILTKPTVTLSAPPGSGTTATASVNTMAADYMRNLIGGTGYAVNDTVTLVGGTFTTAAVFTVSEVLEGVPRRLTITTPGSYTVLPTGPISTTTSGSGAGLTLNVWWRILTMTIDNAGTNYAPGLPPHATWTYTQDGGNRSPLREPKLLITLTPTRARLRLNAGSLNVTGIPTSSVGLAAGDVYSNAGVLTVV
jgi:hypothetical protein